MQGPQHDDLQPRIAAALLGAYARRVDLETAAWHLWRIHQAGRARPAARRATAALRGTTVSLLVVFAILLTGSGAAVAASGGALPGDVLYPVKRGAERAQLLLAVSPHSGASLRLRLAERRLEEARLIVADQPAAVPQLVEDALGWLEAAEQVGGGAVAERAAAVREVTDARIAALRDDIAPEAAKLQVATDGADTPQLPGAPPPPARTDAEHREPSETGTAGLPEQASVGTPQPVETATAGADPATATPPAAATPPAESSTALPEPTEPQPESSTVGTTPAVPDQPPPPPESATALPETSAALPESSADLLPESLTAPPAGGRPER